MTDTIEATYDGQVFRPERPVRLKANTRVTLTIETESTTEEKPASFLETAKSLKLQGPSDWSENIDGYLYSGSP